MKTGLGGSIIYHKYMVINGHARNISLVSQLTRLPESITMTLSAWLRTRKSSRSLVNMTTGVGSRCRSRRGSVIAKQFLWFINRWGSSVIISPLYRALNEITSVMFCLSKVKNIHSCQRLCLYDMYIMHSR